MQKLVTPHRVAVVTGGAMGIGAEVCQRLARDGTHVVIADYDADAAQRTAQALEAEGLQASAITMDVGNSDAIAAGFAQVAQAHGRCDILVNCAGVAKVFPFLDFPLDEFERTMKINVTGTLLCSQHAARLMMQHRWGRIINIASVAGMRAVQADDARAAFPRRVTLDVGKSPFVTNAAAISGAGEPVKRYAEPTA